MKAFKKKQQIREEQARVIAHIVKENFEKFIDDECKTQITLPKPEKIYCMELKFYETPQVYNATLNARETAYNAGKTDTAKKILTDLYRTPPEDLKSKIVKLATEYRIWEII